MKKIIFAALVLMGCSKEQINKDCVKCTQTKVNKKTGNTKTETTTYCNKSEQEIHQIEWEGSRDQSGYYNDMNCN